MKTSLLSVATNVAGIAIILSGITGNLILDGGIASDAGEFAVSYSAMALHLLFLLGVLGSWPHIREAFPGNLRQTYLAIAAPGALVCLLYAGLGDAFPETAVCVVYFALMALAAYGTLSLRRMTPEDRYRADERRQRYSALSWRMILLALVTTYLGAFAGLAALASPAGAYAMSSRVASIAPIALLVYSAYLGIGWLIIRAWSGAFSLPALLANTIPPIAVSMYGILFGFDASALIAFGFTWAFGAALLMRRAYLSTVFR